MGALRLPATNMGLGKNLGSGSVMGLSAEGQKKGREEVLGVCPSE